MKRLLMINFILLVSALNFCANAQSGQPGVYALNPKSLETNKRKVKAKDELIMPAYKQLLKDADKALKFGPVSVMEKTNNPPSGNKHDYMSIAPYFWPDPNKPDGLPYIRKDGQTNPEVKDYKDKEYQPQLCESVYTLGLAYYFTEEKMYAEHAAKLARVWFLDTATRMNPNLNFGQAIKGVTTGRAAGLIDTRHYVKLIDGIRLIRQSKYWTKKDDEGLKQWFTEFLNWMQTSKIGQDEMKTGNNHGVWYDAQRLAMALYIDSVDLAKKIVRSAENRLNQQLDANGMFPKEMERTISMHYTSFVIEAFFIIGYMADKVGMDFWNYTGPTGMSLKKAFDTFSPYLTQDKEWTGQQIKPYDYMEAYPLLKTGAEHFNCKKCEQAIKNLAGDKGPRLRVHLLY